MSALAVIDPPTLSIAPGAKIVGPPELRNGPSVTEVAARTDGSNPRSNWYPYRSDAPDTCTVSINVCPAVTPTATGWSEIVAANSGVEAANNQRIGLNCFVRIRLPQSPTDRLCQAPIAG